MKEKFLYILAGANGSGKTTIAKELLPEEKLAFVNADEIAKDICPANLESARIKAGRQVFARIDELLEHGKSFALESTLSGSTYVKIIRRARAEGYKVIIMYTFVDNAQSCILRIKNRVKTGGHNIPDEDVIRRYGRSISNFFNIYKNLCDEWVLYYNGEESVVIVAHQEIGKHIEVVNEKLYTVFKEKL